jgi:hypothetical protein
VPLSRHVVVNPPNPAAYRVFVYTTHRALHAMAVPSDVGYQDVRCGDFLEIERSLISHLTVLSSFDLTSYTAFITQNLLG